MLELLFMLAGVVVLDIVLSGDNALVVAMVANQLPQAQRDAAVNFGMAGAVILRLVLLFFAALILSFRFLSVVAGIGLLLIAGKLAYDIIGSTDDGWLGNKKPATNVLGAITSIIFADVSMSFDNVMSVAGLAHKHFFVMVLGVLLSMVFLTKASKWVQGVLEDYPWLNWAGVALIVVAAFNLLER